MTLDGLLVSGIPFGFIFFTRERTLAGGGGGLGFCDERHDAAPGLRPT